MSQDNKDNMKAEEKGKETGETKKTDDAKEAKGSEDPKENKDNKDSKDTEDTKDTKDTEDTKEAKETTDGESERKEAPSAGTPSSAAETQVQAGKVGNVITTKTGDIIYNTTIYKTEKKADKDEKPGKDEAAAVFIDPTKPLPKNPAKLAAFHPDTEIEEKIKQWKQERFVLISCWSEDISYSTAYRLIEKPGFDSHNRRFLDITQCGPNSPDLNLEMFLDHPIGSGNKVVVLIDIDAQCPFFDSIFVRRLTAQRIKEELKQKDILLIALLNPQLMKQAREEKGEDFVFSWWDIDFLPHLLKNYFPDRWEPLAQDILQQREKGLWGDKDDDGEFYSNLKKELNLGKEVFSEKVKKRQEFDESRKNLDEFMGNIKEVKANEFFVDEEPVKTVIYTGVFFPRLTPLDFDVVVRELLKEKTTVREKSTQVVTENGETKTVTEQEEKMALEIWEKGPDKLLSQCHLKAVLTDHSPQYIEFVYPYLRNDLEDLIKESYPIYLRQQFQQIQHSGMFFASNVSESITEDIIRLAVNMAVLHPDYYGYDWLNEFIFQVKVQFNLQSEPTHNLPVAIFQFLSNLKNKKIRRHFYSQVSRLIREMLNYQQLREVVRNFLDHLFTVEGHDAVLHIALNVGKPLLFTPRFDLFYWLRRVLDQAPGDIKDEAYELLHQLAIERNFHIHDILETLRTWLPDEKKEIDHFSPSNRCALLFIVHYCSGTLHQFNEKSKEENLAGRWPSPYPLFAPFKEDESSPEKRLENIVEWLLHPQLETVFNQYLKQNLDDDEYFYFDMNLYLTEIMIEWASVLLGPEYQKGNPEAKEILDILLRQIALKVNTRKGRKRQLLEELADKRIYFRDKAYDTERKNKQEWDRWNNKYKIAKMLYSRFREFAAQG